MAAPFVMRPTRRRLLAVIMLLLSGPVAVAGPGQYGSAGFELALPGYVFEFPRDHGAHDAYQTEWWYYTGQVKTANGRSLGFELTFFRVGVTPPSRPAETAWDLRDLALAHFAISDISRREFRYHEKLSRATPFTAAARQGSLEMFNEGWKAATRSDGSLQLKARDGGDAIDFRLVSTKPPAIHGQDGISTKGPGLGNASHYYSLTRLVVDGTITARGTAEKCKGLAWMDHEFGSSPLRDGQGWDWFSLQMDNETELMIYILRRPDGKPGPASAGSLVLADGNVIHLKREDIQITRLGTWTSPRSGGTYPMGWNVRIAPVSLTVNVQEKLKDQELITRASTQVTYWEGAVGGIGTFGGTPVRADGYVEMTGYAK
ncbi:MAG TPA: lipocalin-like domain-containing protein [Thermoanaerobaculia bacterium]|nr:lipocalin-like domain-containing protein [Thermoanaerobaculia bacterium]